MKEYGDTVLYRVSVDVFCNKQLLEVNSAEIDKERERLVNLGYVVAIEKYDDGSNTHYYFTLRSMDIYAIFK